MAWSNALRNTFQQSNLGLYPPLSNEVGELDTEEPLTNARVLTSRIATLAVNPVK
jgi:hypothetical protein